MVDGAPSHWGHIWGQLSWCAEVRNSTTWRSLKSLWKWDGMPQQTTSRLVNSMRSRCQNVINAQERVTRHWGTDIFCCGIPTTGVGWLLFQDIVGQGNHHCRLLLKCPTSMLEFCNNKSWRFLFNAAHFKKDFFFHKSEDCLRETSPVSKHKRNPAKQKVWD